jgi:ring-1,2-phenylacetyl-CoA epoxidase subunit PaaE
MAMNSPASQSPAAIERPLAPASPDVSGASPDVSGANPSPAAPPSAAWRRDLRAIVDGLRGVTPPSFRPRRPRRSDVLLAAAKVPSPASGGDASRVLKPRSLVVSKIQRETPDAVTIFLRDPAGAAMPFSAGQFLTLLISPPGHVGPPLRRAYSICTPPLDAAGQPATTLAITCKRVAGGVVSSYLNEGLAEGAVLPVLGPSGNFTPEPRADRARHLVLIGGGSGITPLMSIVGSVLQSEPDSQITLLYGNRGLGDVIFYDTLSGLAAAHPGRLHLRHVLSEPPADWRGGQGLLDRRTLLAELASLSLLPSVPSLAIPGQVDSPGAPQLPREYYLCGPAPMMEAARQVLTAAGVPDSQIWEERFASLHDTTFAPAPASREVALRLELRRLGAGPAAASASTAVVRPGETLLEAGLATGAELPFSCAMGGCGACKGKLLSGQVRMPEPNCLTPAERAAGYVLPCIAQPCGDVAVAIER